MKNKDNPIPQYLLDELEGMVKVKDHYTEEEINQIINDLKQLDEQMKQFEEAKEWGAISKEECSITKIMLMAKQLLLQETSARARRQLEKEKEQLYNRLVELVGN
jgi:ATP-dependent Clp protease ATP-binding subunit ClpA